MKRNRMEKTKNHSSKITKNKTTNSGRMNPNSLKCFLVEDVFGSKSLKGIKSESGLILESLLIKDLLNSTESFF